MKAVRFALVTFLFSLLSVSLAQAQVQRTVVSGLGSDGNPCSRTAPCRTFGTAIDHVRLEGSTGSGLTVEQGSKVTVRNSIASGNFHGFHTMGTIGSYTAK